MEYTLRPYQEDAVNAAVQFFQKRDKGNGIIILPTGSGKSIVLAAIAKRLRSKLLVFCPSAEILKQNYSKGISLGLDCAMYSASTVKMEPATVTYVTIGSVKNLPHLFSDFDYICIDECHLVNSKQGMYRDFLSKLNKRVIGCTATPYRLSSFNGQSILKFLTRTRPRVFDSVIYYCQISELLAKGYLASLSYYDITSLDMSNVKSNSTGADYDDKSLVEEYERSGFYSNLLNTVYRLLHPKVGGKRRGILVFTRFIREAQMVVDNIPNSAIVTGETPKKERERLLTDFKRGKIQVLANSGVLTTGYDYPELDTIVMGRPTKSLSLWYQIVGRGIRPSAGKTGWIVDLCGNIKRFGKVEDLKIECPANSERWIITSKGKQLTNVFY